MNYRPLICPICNKSGKLPHYTTCRGGAARPDFKLFVLSKNYPKLNILDREIVNTEYTLNQRSSVDFANLYDIKYKHFEFIMNYHDIKLRKLFEANNTSAIKEKYKLTCQSQYGTSNALSKNGPGYETRKITLADRYGCVNVFQLKHVIDKITETHLRKYGRRRVNPYEGLTDEQKYAIHRKKIETMRTNKTFGFYYRINKLETRVAERLTSLGISHEYSFFSVSINTISK